ncbi:MAG: hypothetical protein PHI85_02550 [Victivallaceae bacterium]|nr:hypothetical protein [Victivallaceae bacterium]
MKARDVVMAAAALALAAGCSGLEHKAVVVDSSVQGFKITSGADASGGTPLPNISAGWGRNLLITMPDSGAGVLEYESESGSLFGEVFGVEVTDKTRVRIISGRVDATCAPAADESTENE